ncbi:translocator protein 2 isoform 1 [Anopheles sinensis]|uniref:Translocator protein 2 isoform 1 n=1 Tax=Anopheles sinensis TaxID=74873 RepID=A0A084VZ64_ANOSI|nr:translocator protein 2 isoform 1 [Anopheles sinensis]
MRARPGGTARRNDDAKGTRAAKRSSSCAKAAREGAIAIAISETETRHRTTKRLGSSEAPRVSDFGQKAPLERGWGMGE